MTRGGGGGVLPYKSGRGVQPTNSKTHLQYDTFVGTCSMTVVNFDTSSMTVVNFDTIQQYDSMKCKTNSCFMVYNASACTKTLA